MNPDQFAQFIAHERAERQADRDNLQQDHAARQEVLEDSNRRSIADSQVKNIVPCDGHSAKSVREWIREVELTLPYTNRTIYVASQSARGSLRRELERFLEGQPIRANVTWPQARTHLQNSFLSQHEADQLRDDVKRVKQASYESSAAYGRRFRDAAGLGYPVANRNNDQHRMLLNAYYKGLKDRTIVERLIKEGHPNNFDDAIQLVSQYESDNYRLQKALDEVDVVDRQEEPMEIGATSSRVSPVVQPQCPTPVSYVEEVKTDIGNLKRQVGGMTKQLTKLVAATGYTKGAQNTMNQPWKQPWKQSGRKPSKYKFTADGRFICAFCNKIGHKQVDCYARKRWAQQNQNVNQGGQ